MLNKKKFGIFAIVIVVLIIGCQQIIYETYIQGAWKVDEYYKNGIDDTTAFYLFFGDYVIKFHPDGNFTETYKLTNLVPITNSGTWEVINNASQLQLIDGSSTRTFDILGISNDELRLYRELENGENEEFILEPKEETQSY